MAVQRSHPVSLDEIQGIGCSCNALSLCETLSIFDGGAAVYRVESMTSYMEPVAERGGAEHPSTYIELSLVRAWSAAAPEAPVVRTNGGVYPDGVYGGFDISLRRGEVFGALLAKPSDANFGFYGLEVYGVFRDEDNTGRLTNGILFTDPDTTPAEIERSITQAAAREPADCHEVDVSPDF